MSNQEPQCAQLEVSTQTGTDTVIGMRVEGGWTSWQTYWPDETVISVTDAQFITTSELTQMIGKVWREGRDHGAQYPYGKKGPGAHDKDNPYRDQAEWEACSKGHSTAVQHALDCPSSR